MLKTVLGFIGLGGTSTLGLWLVAGAIAGAFGGGMYTMAQFNKANLADDYDEQNTRLRDAVRRTVAEAETLQRENDEVTEAALQAERRATADYLAATKGMRDAKPDKCIDESFPTDRRRLLNLATTGRAYPEPGLPQAAGASAEKAAAPATPVTYGDQVDYTVACGLAYRKLWGDYNALMDFYQVPKTTGTRGD